MGKRTDVPDLCQRGFLDLVILAFQLFYREVGCKVQSVGSGIFVTSGVVGMAICDSLSPYVCRSSSPSNLGYSGENQMWKCHF